MDIASEKLDNFDLVKMEGRIDSNTAPELRKAFSAITEAGRFKILFDMGGVDYISSSGVWVLLDTQKTCKKRNRGELRVANVNENIEYTLDLAGLKHFIQIYDTIEDAQDDF